MKRLLFALAFLALPALAHAQAITSVRIVVSGGAAPVTNDLPIASVTCGLSKSTEPVVLAGTTHNPSELDWDDPSAPTTLYCRYKDTGTAGTPSPLIGLPFGATVYTATAAFVNSVGPGPASAVSNPFDHPGQAPATAPTGLRVTQ